MQEDIEPEHPAVPTASQWEKSLVSGIRDLVQKYGVSAVLSAVAGLLLAIGYFHSERASLLDQIKSLTSQVEVWKANAERVRSETEGQVKTLQLTVDWEERHAKIVTEECEIRVRTIKLTGKDFVTADTVPAIARINSR